MSEQQYQLTQLWSDRETRHSFGMAVTDGQPVRLWEADMDESHYLSVPTVQGILIPLDKKGKQHFWIADFCEICRRQRLFRPVEGYERYDHNLPKVPNNG